MENKFSQSKNLLGEESSPYLLQHANNPVHWQAWSEQAFQKAAREDKLVIISIGYSSCHWCHVMAHECFEDSAAAAIMNEHFVSIKVDREERPDVDQVYMTALQLMTGQGGWPLNVVCLPDGRPVWGATYVPRERWKQSLKKLWALYQSDSAKMYDYASQLHAGIAQSELVQPETMKGIAFTRDDARKMINTWRDQFDTLEGGPNRAPKFPMPNNYLFLLEYAHVDESGNTRRQVELTLDKMAWGGLYDQIGGGFARYSTDLTWTVPHFEKMLYDNAQLVQLYSQAYRKFGKPLYLKIVRESIAFLNREMTDSSGAYFSALDADSEGEEGKFYVWQEHDLKEAIGSADWPSFTKYFDLRKGNWEGKIILTRTGSEEDPEKLNLWRSKLMNLRAQRPRPGVDNKCLTSWNALMISALVEACRAMATTEGEQPKLLTKAYLGRAEKLAKWIHHNQSNGGQKLYHSYHQGQSSVEGIIEDYAFTIQAFLDLHEYTGQTDYLKKAEDWMLYTSTQFQDTTSALFYTRPLEGEQLIVRSHERVDNVMPSSNSVMAHNLWRLGFLLGKREYRDHAQQMLNRLDRERLLNYAESYSNWGRLLLRITFPQYEVVIYGERAFERYQEFQKEFLPHVIWLWRANEEELALLENRYIPGKTMIYVCQDKVCQLPVEKVSAALKQLAEIR